jgi:hypothetical protein
VLPEPGVLLELWAGQAALVRVPELGLGLAPVWLRELALVLVDLPLAPWAHLFLGMKAC